MNNKIVMIKKTQLVKYKLQLNLLLIFRKKVYWKTKDNFLINSHLFLHKIFKF